MTTSDIKVEWIFGTTWNEVSLMGCEWMIWFDEQLLATRQEKLPDFCGFCGKGNW